MDIDDVPCPTKELKYHKGENRHKHCGHHVDAQMVRVSGGHWVGKCPKDFSQEVAQELLQNGVPEFRKTAPEHPYRIWAYYDGAIYVAHTQDGGDTWHGFPNGHPMNEPPRSILTQLQQRAQTAGDEAQLKKWLNKRWN